MKLLYLTPGCFDKGGISRYSRYQIRAWRELLGAENVGVFSLLGPDEHSFEEPIEVDYAAGSAKLSSKVAFSARAAAWALKHAPSVVQSAHVHLSGMARLVAAPVRARTVVNIYGLEVWSGLRRDATFGLRSADRVVSDCRFTANYVEEQGLRASGTTDILWDCVDTSRFTPREPAPEVVRRYGLPDRTRHVVLLTFGRMSHDAAHKGYERLLQVFRKVAEACPKLVLVFGGGGSLAEELRAVVAGSPLAERVRFIGRVREEDLADVYRAAHLFSLVSDRGVGRGEGLPLTPIEAGACGVPILVGNQDGSQEAVVDGENGFVLDPFDLDAHAERLTALYRDAELRQRMGAAARRRVERFHAYEVFRDQMAAQLRGLGVAHGSP